MTLKSDSILWWMLRTLRSYNKHFTAVGLSSIDLDTFERSVSKAMRAQNNS